MITNEPGRVTRSKPEWAAIIEEQERSGESAAGFCRERAIRYSQFLYRRKTLSKKRQSLTMPGSPRGVSVPGSFIPIRVEAGTSIRLRFPMGLVLESDHLPSAAWVVELARLWVNREDSPC
jgi:hypothetical protein